MANPEAPEAEAPADVKPSPKRGVLKWVLVGVGAFVLVTLSLAIAPLLTQTMTAELAAHAAAKAAEAESESADAGTEAEANAKEPAEHLEEPLYAPLNPPMVVNFANDPDGFMQVEVQVMARDKAVIESSGQRARDPQRALMLYGARPATTSPPRRQGEAARGDARGSAARRRALYKRRPGGRRLLHIPDRSVMDNNNVLSKEETAALLQGIQDGSVETERGAASAGQVKPYDFAERNSIVRGNLPGLERIHERFARELSLSLSTLLRREVEVAPLALHEHKLGDYLRTLSAPSSLNLFDARPLPGPALLALDPVLVYLAVDSYFGGPARAPATIAPRPLTAGEQRVIELVRERAFAELRNVGSIKPLDSRCRRRAIAVSEFAADAEPVLVARFEVKLGQGTGALHVALPARRRPVREQLDAPAGGRPAVASQNEWSAR
jgi:flagellar motor switch protein FliM